ncbi:MAG: prephenate dehydratase [Candidatus Altiarchaeota archaeon]|nr:prephenate dehydratase [Candidatus Altiarchaeota archaeon]
MKDRIAVLGPAGTFTEAAARRLFKGATLEYESDVEDVFRRVASGKICGVVAIENSLEGSVSKNLEYLMAYDVKICGEVTLDINLCLMKKPMTKSIDAILSHPHALAQCRRYLKKHYPKARLQPADSTTAAMQELSKLENAAAIGPKQGARTYGLSIVDESIQDDASQTRFIALSKKECKKARPAKTSIIYAVKDEPGALYSTLKVFSDAKVNLTKIESRPSRRKLGEYVFYVDFENGSLDGKGVGSLVGRIRDKSSFLKNLGSY